MSNSKQLKIGRRRSIKSGSSTILSRRQIKFLERELEHLKGNLPWAYAYSDSIIRCNGWNEYYELELEGYLYICTFGCVGIVTTEIKNVFELVDLYVHPKYRRQGRGLKLVREALFFADYFQIDRLVVRSPETKEGKAFWRMVENKTDLFG